MAAAFFNHLVNTVKAQAVSAGTEPGERVHPEVQAVMSEIGIDLSGAKPQKLTEKLARDAQLLITMGCGDKCPYVPGLRRDDWPPLTRRGWRQSRSAQYAMRSSCAFKNLSNGRTLVERTQAELFLGRLTLRAAIA